MEFYFTNVKLYWPYDLYKYSEDMALNYLVKHNYDVELALALISKFRFINLTFFVFIVVDIDDLVGMMRRQDDNLTRTIANYDLIGSKIYHAKLSIRDSNMPIDTAAFDD